MSGNGDQSEEELISLHRKGRSGSRKSEPKSAERVERLYALHKLWLDSIQRILCLGLAVWVLLQTSNTVQFLIILAAGFIDIHAAKKILAGAIKAVTSDD